MITADQLIAHAVGDYILQSDWMATEKTKRSVAALAHVVTYALPFLLLTQSWQCLAFIIGTHFVIDRWRLARFICWAKNWLAPAKWCPVCDDRIQMNGWHAPHRVPRNPPWNDCKATGYPADRPVWLTGWLLIIVDNTLHIILNGIALHYFS